MNTTPSFTLAAAAVAILVAGCSAGSGSSVSTGQAGLVKCEGVNTCKGTSECKSAGNTNGCQGLNDCKGQGWISIPKADCDAKGGRVLADSSAMPSPSASDSGASAPVTAKSVKCEGINACKGQSACKTASSSCKGQNSCKGKGFLEVPSEADCTKAGGKVMA